MKIDRVLAINYHHTVPELRLPMTHTAAVNNDAANKRAAGFINPRADTLGRVRRCLDVHSSLERTIVTSDKVTLGTDDRDVRRLRAKVPSPKVQSAEEETNANVSGRGTKARFRFPSDNFRPHLYSDLLQTVCSNLCKCQDQPVTRAEKKNIETICVRQLFSIFDRKYSYINRFYIC